MSSLRAQRRGRTVLALLSACVGCDQRYWVCPETDESALAELPERLSQTQLFSDFGREELAPGVLPYAPRFELWSDGAAKRRWIFVPPGSVIDTADMDQWKFPPGTRLWKEFAQDGVRIETRLLAKLGADDADWRALAYVWQADQEDAIATPYGASDAGGTTHDVPASGECAACHGGRESYVLGFSAVQLAFDATAGELDLDRALESGLLSVGPEQPIELPGDAIEQGALGYLHANCSHCHNQSRPKHSGPRCYDPQNSMDFSLRIADLGAVASTATYRSVVGEQIKPGDSGGSRVVELMSDRGFFSQMPPLATERVDTAGLDLVRRWIERLP
jgi:hypothetical protein